LIIYKENYGLIFLKWTRRNGWSSIGNNSRSNLEHTIFLFTKDIRRLHGTLSYVQAPILTQGSCVRTTVDRTYLSQTELNSLM